MMMAGWTETELDRRRCQPSSGYDGKQVKYDAYPPQLRHRWHYVFCAQPGSTPQAELLSDQMTIPAYELLQIGSVSKPLASVFGD